MSTAKIYEIAVFVAGLDEEYQSNVITGINDFAVHNNVNISYFSAFGGMLDSKRFDIGEYSIYELANMDRFDGAILMTNTINDIEVKKRIIERITASGVPAVVFDCAEYPQLYNISINNVVAMEEMVRHVIKVHGAKIINYISGPMTNPEARDRLQAFRTVMEENGLDINEDRIYYGDFRSFDGRNAIEKFMRSGMKMPDAFICANDAMALTAVSTLEKHGLKVPDDVIVTGFDYTYSARNYCPSLTSVKRPLEEAGALACKTILNVIEGSEPGELVLDASCVFSESCGCGENTNTSFGDYRKRTHNRIERTNDNIHKLNILTATLADTETLEEAVNAIGEFASELECQKFTLCLTNDWQDTFKIYDRHGVFGVSMTAPLIWDNGNISSRSHFPASYMNPSPLQTGGNISYYMPIHFRERVLGYFIMTNSDFPISSLLCHTFSMDLSNSIENIRKLAHINKAMEELNRLYVIDPLSNLYNRNGFIKTVDDKFKICVKEKRSIMLTFIDMDGLKYINDNYGHKEGDFAIQRLAGVIRDCSHDDSVCARFGGDEFVIFDSDITEADADDMKRRFDANMENINHIISKPYTLSASLGSIICTPSETDTLYSLITKADELMYEVKRNKKNSRTGNEVK